MFRENFWKKFINRKSPFLFDLYDKDKTERKEVNRP